MQRLEESAAIKALINERAMGIDFWWQHATFGLSENRFHFWMREE